MAIGEHGPRCEGPDEDGDWTCPDDGPEPGLCPRCLHIWGVERQMGLGQFQDGRRWFICYTCWHGC